MAENHCGTHFHKWGQNSNAYNLYIDGKEIFIRINVVLTTRVQKWAYIELLIENQKDVFLKVVGFFC